MTELPPYEIDQLAFETHPDRGYTCKASYLKSPKGDALIEIFKDGQPLRAFLFPAYKIWNISAHFTDIVDGEIQESARGYEMAAWDGISGAALFVPNADSGNSVIDASPAFTSATGVSSPKILSPPFPR